MTTTHDIQQPADLGETRVRDRCLSCAFPLPSEKNVFSAINRFTDILQHAGFLASQLSIDTAQQGRYSITCEIRRIDSLESHDASRKDKATSHANTHRQCHLGTASCCSTNSLCKAHACHHRTEETEKTAPSPPNIPASEIPFTTAEAITNPPPFGANASISVAGAASFGSAPNFSRSRRQNTPRQSRQTRAKATAATDPPSQHPQPSDAARLQASVTSADLTATQGQDQVLASSKRGAADSKDVMDIGASTTAQSPRGRSQNRAGAMSRSQRSLSVGKASAARRARADSQQQVSQEQGDQQNRSQWSTEENRIAPAQDLEVHQGPQVRTAFASLGPAVGQQAAHQTGMHHVQQGNESVVRDLSRTFSGDLQAIDQPQDGYGSLALAEDSIHASAALTTVPATQERLQLQQNVNHPDAWATQGRHDGVATNSGGREHDRSQVGAVDSSVNVANVAPSMGGSLVDSRNGYSAIAQGGPAPKRARTQPTASAALEMPRPSTDAGSASVLAAAVASQNALNNVNMGDTSTFPCKTCSTSFTLELELRKHELGEHRNQPVLRDPDGRYPCAFTTCDQSFVRRHVMERHMRTVHLRIRDFACSSCDKVFADSSTREVHRAAVHDGKRPWVCTICAISFTQSSSLGKHKRRFHAEAKQESEDKK